MYQNLLRLQAQRFGLIADLKQKLTQEQVAYTRLASMLRCNDNAATAGVIEQLNKLESNTRELLIKELNKSGAKSDAAIKIEYAPAMHLNATNQKKNMSALVESLKAHTAIFSQTRKVMTDSKAPVITVHANSIADYIKKNGPATIAQKKIIIEKVNDSECVAKFE